MHEYTIHVYMYLTLVVRLSWTRLATLLQLRTDSVAELPGGLRKVYIHKIAFTMIGSNVVGWVRVRVGERVFGNWYSY